jgi:hypothetical protein
MSDGRRSGLKTVLSFIRVVRQSKLGCRILPQHGKESEVCFVLGNGPSLYQDVADKLEFLSTKQVVCVNQFANSDWFEKIKPKYYVLVDPMWWLDSAPPQTIVMRNNLINSLLEQTAWPLYLFLPHEAKKLFEPRFSKSKFIRLVFFNRTPLWGIRSYLYKLFDRGLGMPQTQNVLIAAIFLSMRLGFKKIALLGADHSWHETLVLDENNQVCVKYGYFNDREPKLAPFTIDGSTGNIFTMDKIFLAIGRMFSSYREIEMYSHYLNVDIINLSSVTFIDAFKRKNISQFLAEQLEP